VHPQGPVCEAHKVIAKHILALDRTTRSQEFQLPIMKVRKLMGSRVSSVLINHNDEKTVKFMSYLHFFTVVVIHIDGAWSIAAFDFQFYDYWACGRGRWCIFPSNVIYTVSLSEWWKSMLCRTVYLQQAPLSLYGYCKIRVFP
jgi:hypothetical protein